MSEEIKELTDKEECSGSNSTTFRQNLMMVPSFILLKCRSNQF